MTAPKLRDRIHRKPHKKRMLIIVNPYAKTVSDRLRNLVVYALQGRFDVEAVSTQAQNHATQIGREACDGGFAEELVLPASALTRVPADLDPLVAAMAEPLAVALHAARRSGARENDAPKVRHGRVDRMSGCVQGIAGSDRRFRRRRPNR